MATSVHLPKGLLEAVDKRARALKISRNRLIVRALERELTHYSQWSPGFFEGLRQPDPETRQAVDELLRTVRRARRPSRLGVCEVRARHECRVCPDEGHHADPSPRLTLPSLRRRQAMLLR